MDDSDNDVCMSDARSDVWRWKSELDVKKKKKENIIQDPVQHGGER